MTGPRESSSWIFEVEGGERPNEALTPPIWAAGGAVVAGGISVILAMVLHGSAGFFGWTLGFGAILLAAVYRTMTRTVQMKTNFSPRKSYDALMVLGAGLGLVGVLANAFVIAQRTLA